MGKPAEAVQKSAQQYVDEGVVFYSTGRMEEAAEKFRQALKIDPMHAGAHANLGGIYGKQQRYEEAEKELLKSLEIDPTLAVAMNNIGECYFSQRRYADAEIWYKKALVSGLTHILVFRGLGQSLFRQGKFREAIPVYEQIVQLYPNDTDGYFVLAGLYVQVDERAKARKAIQQCLRLDPNHSEAKKMADRLR